MVEYTYSEGWCYIQFNDAETNKELFNIIADLDQHAKYVPGDILEYARVRGFDISIKGGKYDGVVLVKHVKYNDIMPTLNAVAFQIHNDDDLRRIVALFVSHDPEQLLMIHYAEIRD